MKNFIMGLIIGAVVGGGIGWAAGYRISIVDENNVVLGTAANPLHIK